MARSKLSNAASGTSKDSSLHRFVLIKNSLLRSNPVEPTPPPAEPAVQVQHVYRSNTSARDSFEEDAFMFPDPHDLGPTPTNSGASESQWLDSLLEDLGDDDDYADVEGPVASSSSSPADEEDEQLSPLCSPSSSSDDLVGQPSGLFCQPPPIAVPYPVPYPPLRSPLAPSWLQLDSYNHDPLPYFDADEDVEDLCMPEAIEDTSDDESDALSTPYSQSMSSLPPTDPASVPLPEERTRLRGHPHVYVESDNDYFYPFELDPPLPFHEEERPNNDRVFHPPIYQEC